MPFMVFKNIHTPFAYQNISSMRPCAQSKWPGCVTWLARCSAKAQKLFFPFCLFNLILCWTLFIAKNLWKIATYILKTAQTFGTLAPDAVTYHSDWSKVMTKEKVSSSLDCLWMLVMKHFNTHNVWLTDISEPLTPKIKLSDNQFYMHCKAISPLQIGGWGNVLICHVCEWKHWKPSRECVRFQGSNSMVLFTFKK